LHLFFDLPLDKACPGDFDPCPCWQGFFAAPSRRLQRSGSRVRLTRGWAHTSIKHEIMEPR
jgi:hypothetical protein